MTGGRGPALPLWISWKGGATCNLSAEQIERSAGVSLVKKPADKRYCAGRDGRTLPHRGHERVKDRPD
jgi:hypothetical protein